MIEDGTEMSSYINHPVIIAGVLQFSDHSVLVYNIQFAKQIIWN